MGVTNLRFGRDFLQRAGWAGGFEDLALIPNCSKNVLIVAKSFEQEEIEQYKDLIYSLRNNIWLQQDARDKLICSAEPGLGLQIPKCVVSPCLTNTNSARDKPSATSTSLAYLVVIQGREGSLRSKLLILSSVQDVGAEMFYHAANGWSAVFSGAILQSDLKRLGGLSVLKQSSIRLEKVSRVDELGVSDERIPIWCYAHVSPFFLSFGLLNKLGSRNEGKRARSQSVLTGERRLFFTRHFMTLIPT